MNILIAGASGFIGKQLVLALQNKHVLTVLGRNLEHLHRTFPETINKVSWNGLNELNAATFDVIINLSGSNIGDKRWSPQIKQELIQSRVQSNQSLIDWIKRCQATPRILCANAVGIYGLQAPDDVSAYDEDSPIDLNQTKDFLNEIGSKWQQSLAPAIEHGLSVTTLRFGVVLKQKEGMLKKLELPFSLGLGSILGDGKQTLSWIDIDDVIGAILFLLEHPEANGAFNLVAPHPVSQQEFAKTFAKILNRPLLFTMPSMAVKILFGEMGECLLLKGQRVVPKRLTEMGYSFKYPTIAAALHHEYKE